VQTVARARLAAELRRARVQAGLTGVDLAARLGERWDQPRVSRTERCAPRIPSARAVANWAVATGADPEPLLNLRAEAAAEYAAFSKTYSTAGGAAGFQDALAAREAAATRILVYFPGIILGLVQTSAYAREVLRLPPGAVDAGAGEEEIARMVAARIRRQAILYESGRELVLLMGEGALHTRYVPDHVHRDQLLHLADVAEAVTTATIGIVPFTARLPVVTLHGWVVRDQVVTIEHADGDVTIAAPSDVARYVEWTRQLLDIALTGRHAAELARSIAARR
jgi:transcriptional regulator with XRE-family HTH domain